MKKYVRSATSFAMCRLSPRLRRVKASFDPAWYAARYPDVAASGEQPFAHFVRIGRREGRCPNPVEETRRIWEPRFDAAWYAARYPDVVASSDDLLDHFLRFGLPEGRFSSEREEVRTTWEESFDPAWYAGRYPDVAAAGSEPLDHFLGCGFREGRSPNAEEEARRSQEERFDARWYVERYPDVAGLGEEPLAHFVRVGLAEGRYANAVEEERAALAKRFDRAWYVARNPDIAHWELGPFDHFLQFGLAEARSPNAAEEPRSAWETRFDRSWYLVRHEEALRHGQDPLEHFLTEGLVRGLAPNPAEERRENWTGIFDEEWYLDQNEDVAGSDLDPLLHYIRTGIQERRRPNGRVQLAGPAATAARARWIKRPVMRKELVLFVTHSADGALKPHVPIYLAAIRAAGLGCILIVASDVDEPRLKQSEIDLIDGVLLRENTGFDFAAWAHVISLSPPGLDIELLILANDSVFGPTSIDRFRELIDRIRESICQVVGLTENFERGWHIQSYFIALKAESARDPRVLDFFANVQSLQHKEQVVNEYETKFGRLLDAAGYQCVVLYPSQDTSNVTLRKWKTLLDRGLPFLKVSAVNRTLLDVDIVGWRQALGSEGYDVAKADATLSQLAAAPSQAAASYRAQREPAEALLLHRFLASGHSLELAVSQEPFLTIVLITRDKAERAYRLLEQARILALPAAEYIAVNNGSIDDTAFLLGRLRNVRLIDTVEPLRPVRALGEAARQAGGQAVLALDDSVTSIPGNLEDAMRLLFLGEEIGFVAWRDEVRIGRAGLGARWDSCAPFPMLFRRQCLVEISRQRGFGANQTAGSVADTVVEAGYRVAFVGEDAPTSPPPADGRSEADA